jgi:hypothetical protein
LLVVVVVAPVDVERSLRVVETLVRVLLGSVEQSVLCAAFDMTPGIFPKGAGRP